MYKVIKVKLNKCLEEDMAEAAAAIWVAVAVEAAIWVAVGVEAAIWAVVAVAVEAAIWAVAAAAVEATGLGATGV